MGTGPVTGSAGSTGSGTAITVTDVDKIFLAGRQPVAALSGLNLRIRDGEFLCVIGPSGCGKSTLLRIIGGLEQASTGQVELQAASQAAPKVAFMFQEYGVFPWLTVLANAEFGLRMQGMPRDERKERARAWLRRVGLETFEKAYPEALSGGMKQRLALARAFALEPDVLLMDEPFGALDAETRNLLQEDLLALWENSGRTVVLVTHSIEEAILLGDRIVVMSYRPGRIKESFEVGLGRPRTAATAASASFAELRGAIWGCLRSEVTASMGERG